MEDGGGRKRRILGVTIDSGASENAIGRGMAPEHPLRPSAGSKAEVTCVMANGTEMPYRPESARCASSRCRSPTSESP